MLFKSERLSYRLWTEEDLEAGLALWGNVDVMIYIEPVLNREQVKMSIKRGLEHYETYGTQLFAMVLEDKIIGCCGFSFEEEGVYEFGIHILPDYHRQGFGYEAGKAALKFLSEKGDYKVIAACLPENTASRQLLFKLGFVYHNEIWFDDTNRYESYFELN